MGSKVNGLGASGNFKSALHPSLYPNEASLSLSLAVRLPLESQVAGGIGLVEVPQDLMAIGEASSVSTGQQGRTLNGAGGKKRLRFGQLVA